MKNTSTCMDANIKVFDTKRNTSRYTSITGKLLVLISSKGNGKYIQGIENIWLRNSFYRTLKKGTKNVFTKLRSELATVSLYRSLPLSLCSENIVMYLIIP